MTWIFDLSTWFLRNTSSCQDDHLCHIILKSHDTGQSYELDTMLEHTHRQVGLYMPFHHFMAGHKKTHKKNRELTVSFQVASKIIFIFAVLTEEPQKGYWQTIRPRSDTACVTSDQALHFLLLMLFLYDIFRKQILYFFSYKTEFFPSKTIPKI